MNKKGAPLGNQNAKKKETRVSVSFRLPIEIAKLIKQNARILGMSQSNYIAMLVRFVPECILFQNTEENESKISVSFRLPVEIAEMIKENARKLGISQSNYISILVKLV